MSLTCEAVLSPEVDRFASVTLVLGGPRIRFSERFYTVVEAGFGLTPTSTMTMTGVTMRDQGDCTCTVRVAEEGNVLVPKSFPFAVTGK